MKKSTLALALLSSAAIAASANASLLVADGFDYTAGTTNLVGQTDSDFASNPATWQLTGTQAYSPSVGSGNVTYPSGYGAPANLTGANNAQLIVPSGSNSAADRIQLTTPASAFNPTNSGGTSLYYSFTMKVTSISALATTTAGSFLAGFNNSVGSSSGALTTAGAALCDRTDSDSGTTFHLGIAQNVNTRTYDNTDSYSVGDTLFIVGEYDISSTGAADTAELYVFDSSTPTPDTIPSTQPLTPTVSSPFSAALSGGDNIESFFLRDQGTSFAANIDNVRVGTTWADVTSVPEPASLGLLGLGAFAAVSRRRRMA